MNALEFLYPYERNETSEGYTNMRVRFPSASDLFFHLYKEPQIHKVHSEILKKISDGFANTHFPFEIFDGILRLVIHDIGTEYHRYYCDDRVIFEKIKIVLLSCSIITEKLPSPPLSLE